VTSAADVLRQAPVRRYLTSTALGSVGHDLMVTVLFKQAFDTTHDELDIGLLGLAQFVPAVLLVLVSGWVADRFDRRRVSALFLFGRALGSVALVAYSASSSTRCCRCSRSPS
jgi:MFS family permease